MQITGQVRLDEYCSASALEFVAAGCYWRIENRGQLENGFEEVAVSFLVWWCGDGSAAIVRMRIHNIDVKNYMNAR